MTIALLIILSPFVFAFILGTINGIKRIKNDSMDFAELNEQDEKDAIKEIRQADRIENYDKQLDGYIKLIELLDNSIKTETDPKKKAALLSKQLSTLEKLNRTITKLEKLGE